MAVERNGGNGAVNLLRFTQHANGMALEEVSILLHRTLHARLDAVQLRHLPQKICCCNGAAHGLCTPQCPQRSIGMYAHAHICAHACLHTRRPCDTSTYLRATLPKNLCHLPAIHLGHPKRLVVGVLDRLPASEPKLGGTYTDSPGSNLPLTGPC